MLLRRILAGVMSNKRSLSSASSGPSPKAKKSKVQKSTLDRFVLSPNKSARGVDPPNVDDEDASFQADIELAKRISMGVTTVSSGLATPSGSQGSKVRQNLQEPIEILEDDSEPSLLVASPSKSIKLSTGTHHATDPASYPDLSTDPLKFSVEECPWTSPNSSAPYSFLAHTLNSLSQTRSRIALINILTNTLRILLTHDKESVIPAIYLLSNSLAPPYMTVELGVGGAIVTKAIQNVSGLTAPALRKLYTKSGDAGDVAFAAKSCVRTLIPHPPLLVKGVFSTLKKIANSKGNGAQKAKQDLVERLLVSSRGEESRYITRTLSQNIRVGATRTSVLTAFGRAIVLTPSLAPSWTGPAREKFYASAQLLQKVLPLQSGPKKKQPQDEARTTVTELFDHAEGVVKRVFVQHPNFEDLVSGVVTGGLEDLAHRVPLSVGIPLHNMLGSPTRSLEEIFERLDGQNFSAEMKYDGQRAQIHAWTADADGVDKAEVKIFSRHLEDMTEKYPDVCSLTMLMMERSNPPVKSFIMDSEIVAIKPSIASATDEIELLSFQELSNRPRKDVKNKLSELKVAVCVFGFDLMYLDSEVLLEESFRSRRQKLRSRFSPYAPSLEQAGVARFAHVESVDYESAGGEFEKEKVEEFWVKAVEGRVEGLMVKLLDAGNILEDDSSKKIGGSRRKPLPATYEPDKRTSAWLKLKKDYVTGLGDSLDLVPIGAWHGNGRKAKWWSPILLGLWDERQELFVGVCKCMSGFTDAFYIALNGRYPENSDSCTRESQWKVSTGGLRPSVYFKPQEVWEICGADISLSPVSVAAQGLVSPDRGLSLRFPRFIRVRQDKGTEDASTPEFLAGLWEAQEGRGKEKAVGGADEGELIDGAYESEVDPDERDEEDEG